MATTALQLQLWHFKCGGSNSISYPTNHTCIVATLVTLAFRRYCGYSSFFQPKAGAKKQTNRGKSAEKRAKRMYT